MIVSSKDIKDKLINFLEQKIKDKKSNDFYDEYYYGGYNYNYLLEKTKKDKNNDNLKIITDENNQILTFMFEHKEDNLIIIDIDDNVNTKVLKKALLKIKETYEHPIIYHTYDIYKTDIVYDVNLDSRYSENCTYALTRPLVVLNEEDINIIRDKIEEKEFPEFMGNLKVEVIDNNEILREKQDELNNDTVLTSFWKESGPSSTKIGFHYFGQNDNPEKEDKVLTIKDGENIVGVIKYGIYGDYYNEGIGKHYALCFIDVKKPYRGNGIATKLMEEFGKQLEKENKENETNYPLKLTDESQMGKLCHMKDKAISLIKNIEVIAENHSTYEYERYLNGQKIEKQKDKEQELEIN